VTGDPQEGPLAGPVGASPVVPVAGSDLASDDSDSGLPTGPSKPIPALLDPAETSAPLKIAPASTLPGLIERPTFGKRRYRQGACEVDVGVPPPAGHINSRSTGPFHCATCSQWVFQRRCKEKLLMSVSVFRAHRKRGERPGFGSLCQVCGDNADNAASANSLAADCDLGD
jgi:hypothetical protein